MADDIRYDAEGGKVHSIAPKLSNDQAKTAASILRKSTTAGAGLGKVSKPATGMPRQNPGEAASDYSARVRRWRADKPAIDGQKKALLGMGK